VEADQYGDIRDGKGRFGPGNKAATTRGPNKASLKVREAVVKFLEDNIEALQEDFDTLKPRERLQFMVDIMQYAAPKLSSIQSEIEQTTEHKGKITIEIIKSNGAVETNTGL
jgi:hypothetical protein